MGFVKSDEESKMKNKNKWSYNNVIIFFVIIIILLSNIVYLIIITPSPIGFVKIEDTGSWFGFYGSIIGGALTLLGVWWTIWEHLRLRNDDLLLQEKQRKKDLIEIEERRIKDRRDSIAPFITYEIGDANDTFATNKVIPVGTLLTPKRTEFDESFKSNVDLRTQIVIQNLGLGVVVNPFILEIVYDNETIKFGHDTNIYLRVNEKAIIPLSFSFPDLSQLAKMKMIIKLGYYNILYDFFIQDINIGFDITPALLIEKNNNLRDIKYQCNNIKIINIDLPVISDPSQYKGIKLTFVIPNTNYREKNNAE